MAGRDARQASERTNRVRYRPPVRRERSRDIRHKDSVKLELDVLTKRDTHTTHSRTLIEPTTSQQPPPNSLWRTHK